MENIKHQVVPSNNFAMRLNMDEGGHLKEWDHKIKNQPDVDHLDVGGLWKILRHSDEHCCHDLRL